MLAINLLFSLLLAGFAAAQSNSTSSGNVTLNPPIERLDQSQWCLSQRNTCPLLCGGPKFTAPDGNRCVAEDNSLIWNCTCSNGTGPTNIASYRGTVLNHVCEETFIRCNEANPGAESCKKNCGTLEAKDVPAGTPSASSAAASSTGGDAAASATGEAATPSATGNAGFRFVPEMSLAAGLAAAMGLLL